jgi:hypothetical protein
VEKNPLYSWLSWGLVEIKQSSNGWGIHYNELYVPWATLAKEISMVNNNAVFDCLMLSEVILFMEKKVPVF